MWALSKLRNYLYGITNLTIFTDHQPLTFCVNETNSNLKIKRWKAFIEEFGAKILYKPGKENIVADALSRQYQEDDVDSITHFNLINTTSNSTEIASILKTPLPLNFFRNQVKIERDTQN